MQYLIVNSLSFPKFTKAYPFWYYLYDIEEIVRETDSETNWTNTYYILQPKLRYLSLSSTSNRLHSLRGTIQYLQKEIAPVQKNSEITTVIDNSPRILISGHELDFKCSGIEYPWNCHCKSFKKRNTPPES